jgi:hypothetical protein
MASGEPQPARDMFVQGQPARQLGERPSTGVLRDHAALLCDARDPVRVGRDFADSDTRESPPVAIVNEALATDYRDGRKSACFAVARRRISLALGPTRSTHRPARSARGPDIQRPHSPSDRRGRRTLVVRSIHDGAAVLVPLILFVAAVIYHSRIRRARSRTDRGAADRGSLERTRQSGHLARRRKPCVCSGPRRLRTREPVRAAVRIGKRNGA